MRTTLRHAGAIIVGTAGVLLSTALAGASAKGPDGRSGLAAQPSAEIGWLTVRSEPKARLWIDGSDTGKVTPVTRLELSAGKHKIELVADAGLRRSLGIVITKGEEKRLDVTM
jgi:hypothetical protein